MLLNLNDYISSGGQWAARSLGWGDPRPHEVLRKALFEQGPALPKVDASPMSGLSKGSVFVVSDFTSLYRSTEDLAKSVWSVFPNAPLSWMKGAVSGRDMAIGYQAFGSLTGVNAVLGYVGMYGGLQNLAYAKAINDQQGVLLERITVLKGGSLMGAGVTYGAFRPLSIAARLAHGEATSILNGIAGSMAIAGSGFYSLFFGLLAMSSSLQIVESSSFQARLEEAESFEDKLQVLVKALDAAPDQIKASDEKLKNEALKSGKKDLKKALKELGISNVPREKLQGLLLKVIEESVGGWTSASRQKNVQNELMKIGLSMRVQKLEKKQEAKMQRILSSKGFAALKALKNTPGLLARVERGDKAAIEQARALFQVVEVGLKSRFRENTALTAACLLGVVAMVLGVTITGGVPLIAATAVMLALSISMLAVDGYFLFQSFQNERPANHDKAVLITSTVIGLISLIGMVALSLTGVVTMGTFPLVVSLALTSIWMIQNGVTLGVMKRNEKRYLEKHPTLESFIKSIDRENVMEIFANLSEETKKKIQTALSYSNNSMKEAALSVAREIEEAKSKQLELLRKSFTTYFVN